MDDDKIIPFDRKKPKLSDPEKSKSSDKNLTLDPLKPPPKPEIEHREMEKLAETVALRFRSYDRQLRKLRPEIERIHDYFVTSVRGSVTLAGCASFSEYCAKKLGRTRQAVYSMLGEYPQRAKDKKQRVPGNREHDDDHVPKEAVVRMRRAIEKVQQIRQAKTKDELDAGWREYDEIAAAQPLTGTMDEMQSKIVGDQPDYKRLLRDILVPSLQLLSAVKNVIEAGVLYEGSALLAQAKAALEASKILTAVERRLNIAVN